MILNQLSDFLKVEVTIGIRIEIAIENDFGSTFPNLISIPIPIVISISAENLKLSPAS